MSMPLYLHGPPLASQIWSTSFILNDARCSGSDAAAMKYLLIRASAATRPTNSSTTAVIAGLPPSRSYNDFSLAGAPLTAPHTPTRTIKKLANCIFILRGGAGDPQLSHAVLQRGPLHPKPNRRAIRSAENPFRIFKGGQDVLTISLFQRIVLPRSCGCRANFELTPVYPQY